MLDAIDQSNASDKNSKKDADYVASESESESASDVSNSESIEKSKFKENGSQTALERQVCRIEAKINQLHLVVMQIHRASISNVTSSLLELDRFAELPLKSEEMLNKFELDLADVSYREKIVSIWN